MGMLGDLHIVDDREVGEEADILEGAGDAAPRDGMGFEAGDGLAGEGDGAAQWGDRRR